MMAYCLDIGNTRIKLGVYGNGLLKDLLHFEHNEVNKILEFCSEQVPDAIIISSTATLPQTLIEGMQSSQDVLITLDENTPIPIWNNYSTPGTLGKDRLAAVVGAFNRSPDQNNLVFDAGTCMTYDFIDQQNIYQGGNISPGLNMRYEAMHRFTEKLPLVTAPKEFELTSNHTKLALESGGLLGIIAEIEGVIAKFNRKFRKLNVFITGGDADFLAKKIENEIFVVPNLVLEGLHTILQYNLEHED